MNIVLKISGVTIIYKLHNIPIKELFLLDSTNKVKHNTSAFFIRSSFRKSHARGPTPKNLTGRSKNLAEPRNLETLG